MGVISVQPASYFPTQQTLLEKWKRKSRNWKHILLLVKLTLRLCLRVWGGAKVYTVRWTWSRLFLENIFRQLLWLDCLETVRLGVIFILREVKIRQARTINGRQTKRSCTIPIPLCLYCFLWDRNIHHKRNCKTKLGNQIFFMTIKFSSYFVKKKVLVHSNLRISEFTHMNTTSKSWRVCTFFPHVGTPHLLSLSLVTFGRGHPKDTLQTNM